ncbi:MAG: hypothetical protein JWO77_2775, partial [Ilumatobacteraceae bacterium]|nr:hypothetical protein [Ilumatobacteraceae bacterium]
AEAPSDARPGLPAGRPIDDSPGAEDRRATYDVFILIAALAVLGGLAAKSFSYLRNRS